MLVPTPRMNKTMIPISLIAYDDNPLGLQKMHIDNQLIMSCHILRKDLDRAKDIVPELSQSGIYFLVNTELNNGEYEVYVGKSHNLHNRLRKHDSEGEKRFDAIVAIYGYREDTLDSTAIDWLEKTLIRDIEEERLKGQNIKLINTDKGEPAKLQERRESILVEYAQIIKWYLFRFGYNYESVSKVENIIKDSNKGSGLEESIDNNPEEVKQEDFKGVGESSKEVSSKTLVDDGGYSYLIKGGVREVIRIKTPNYYKEDLLTLKRLELRGKCFGYYDVSTGYTHILKGSKVAVNYKSVKSLKGYIDHSNILKRLNVINYKEGEFYGTLKENIAFISPSSSSSIAIGGSSNGRDEWITKDGIRFGDVYSKG